MLLLEVGTKKGILHQLQVVGLHTQTQLMSDICLERGFSLAEIILYELLYSTINSNKLFKITGVNS